MAWGCCRARPAGQTGEEAGAGSTTGEPLELAVPMQSQLTRVVINFFSLPSGLSGSVSHDHLQLILSLLSQHFPSAEVFAWILLERWKGKDWIKLCYINEVNSLYCTFEMDWSVCHPSVGQQLKAEGWWLLKFHWVDRLCSLIYPNSKKKIIVRFCINWVLLTEGLF